MTDWDDIHSLEGLTTPNGRYRFDGYLGEGSFGVQRGVAEGKKSKSSRSMGRVAGEREARPREVEDVAVAGVDTLEREAARKAEAEAKAKARREAEVKAKRGTKRKAEEERPTVPAR